MLMLTYVLGKAPQEPRWDIWEGVKGVIFDLPNRVWACKAKRIPDLEVPAWMKWTELNKAENRCRKPAAHRGTVTFESQLCQHTRGRRKLYPLCPQQSPGTSYTDPRMSTDSLFGGAKNTTHATKITVTSENGYAPTDFSNKYLPNKTQTLCSKI